MKRKRESLAWKTAAVVVFLLGAAVAIAGTLGALWIFDMGASGDYTQSSMCYSSMLRYADRATEAESCRRQLEGELSYVERQRLEASLEQLEQTLDRENTGFRYQIKSYDGTQVIAGNLEPGEKLLNLHIYRTFRVTGRNVYQEGEYSFDVGESFPDRLTDTQSLLDALTRSAETFGVELPGEMLNDLRLRLEQLLSPSEEENGVQAQILVLECDLAENFYDYRDSIQESYQWFALLQDLLPLAVLAAAASALLALVCLIFLCVGAGHKRGVEGIHLNVQDRLWYDVYLCAAALAAVLLIQSFRGGGYVAVALLFLALTPVALALLLTTVTRCKAGVLFSNTLIWRICRLAGWMVRSLPVTWRVVLAGFACGLWTIFLVANFRYEAILALLLSEAAVVLYLCWWTVCFSRLRRAGEALAGGDLDYRVETGHMPQELRRHGEDLNNISGGMSSAVQEKMKSERFKAELITNVSHDLKTPLTSIINYVDLLKKVDIQDETAREYIQVLDKKSQRLKKLTEDLVEASKASTGTLPVNREKLGMVQLINQALGEYEDKLEERKLQLVTALPEGEVYVLADGRHLWRVLDNLLNNCVKYAMEGTRVYLELARGHAQVILSLKNISREALNIPAEQLMERFVRGEESRTTEGSGLGLSIARSLTELQGGSFALSVDGDLFKATVILPQMV